MNRDMFMNAPVRRSANAAMAVVDALQRGFQPAEQLHGAAAAFLIIADHWGIPAQDLFSATKNLMNDGDAKLRPEFKAVAMYVKEEL